MLLEEDSIRTQVLVITDGCSLEEDSIWTQILFITGVVHLKNMPNKWPFVECFEEYLSVITSVAYCRGNTVT